MSTYVTTEELEAICGRVAAHKLLAAYGGVSVFIPGTLTDDHPLVAVMGATAAEALAAGICTGHGGMQISLPLGPYSARARQRELLRAAVAASGSATTIARQLGVSIRTVRRERLRQLRENMAEGKPE